VAPGVDLDKDVLGKMEFSPKVGKEVKTMAKSLFGPGPMGLAKGLGRRRG